MAAKMTEEELIAEAKRQYHRDYYKKNKKKLREYNRQYRKDNPEKIREINKNYWLRKARELNEKC